MPTLPIGQSDIAETDHKAHVLTVAQCERSLDVKETVRTFMAVSEELGVSCPPDTILRGLCLQVAAISAELFSSDMTVDIRSDPEIPTELHFTFNVVATGSLDEIVARNAAWHRRVRQTIGSNAELFCLSFNVR